MPYDALKIGAFPSLHGSMETRAPLGRSWNWPRARSSSALPGKKSGEISRVWADCLEHSDTIGYHRIVCGFFCQKFIRTYSIFPYDLCLDDKST